MLSLFCLLRFSPSFSAAVTVVSFTILRLILVYYPIIHHQRHYIVTFHHQLRSIARRNCCQHRIPTLHCSMCAVFQQSYSMKTISMSPYYPSRLPMAQLLSSVLMIQYQQNRVSEYRTSVHGSLASRVHSNVVLCIHRLFTYIM